MRCANSRSAAGWDAAPAQLEKMPVRDNTRTTCFIGEGSRQKANLLCSLADWSSPAAIRGGWEILTAHRETVLVVARRPHLGNATRACECTMLRCVALPDVEFRCMAGCLNGALSLLEVVLFQPAARGGGSGASARLHWNEMVRLKWFPVTTVL